MNIQPIPPRPDERFSAFPPMDLLPEAVRAEVAKLLDLRTKSLDAREVAHEARAAIGEADKATIEAAAAKLADGEDAEPDSKPVDAAHRRYEDAVRNLKALEQAMTRIEDRLVVLFKANVQESRQLATDALDEAKAGYANALNELSAARMAYYRAASIDMFSRAFEGAQVPAIVGFRQTVPDEGPIRILAVELQTQVINTQGGPGVNAQPHPRPAGPDYGVPPGAGGMVFH